MFHDAELGPVEILAALDQTIVVTALPTIGRALGKPDYLPWVVTAYLLSSTAVTPLYGKVPFPRRERRQDAMGLWAAF